MEEKLQICFLTASLFCLFYFIVVCMATGSFASFSCFWLFLGFVFGVLSWLYGKNGRLLFPGIVRFLLTAATAAGLLILLYGSIRVLSGTRKTAAEEADYCIVLGAKVNAATPSRALRYRLEAALDYAVEHPGTKLVLSGGKGGGEEISEAECMKNWLLDKGISEDRLILEDESTSTVENLKFSDQLTGCSEHTVCIVSNDFHIYRAVRLAETLGYRHVSGLPARSDLTTRPHYVVREAAALLLAGL